MKEYYFITKNDEDDFELWVTNYPDDESTGWSTRGTRKQIRDEITELLQPTK